ncbi:hypothetical protein [Mycobacteroides franklinii]|uniref:hypothetical protein n=1 Tax=Mycobacteroides franklinii TaxID=948102 RepID=UPI0012FF8806|nr:hypothetical protein [Mycobacteroides franklinii]
MTQNALIAPITLVIALSASWWVSRSSQLGERLMYGVSLTVWAVVVGAMMW